MIYEGMKVSIYSNGNYEVRYQVEAPLAEITLRMQLHFHTPCGKTGTITLAPAHIHDDRDDDPNVSSQSFLVIQKGHSEALHRACGQLAQDIANDNVQSLAIAPFSRTGTTRFGSIPKK